MQSKQTEREFRFSHIKILIDVEILLEIQKSTVLLRHVQSTLVDTRYT